MGAPQFQQLEQIVAMPGPDRCAPVADDCSSFGCCAISGYYCFETSKGKAKCMKNCTPSKTQACIQTQPIMNPILKDAAPVTTSLYCFSTYMAETGQTKKSVDELGNLQLQYKRDIGIFQCDFWQVFTEGDAELAPGVPFVKVFDTDGRPPTPSRGIHSLRGRNDRWPFFVFQSSAAKPSLFEPAPWYRSTDW